MFKLIFTKLGILTYFCVYNHLDRKSKPVFHSAVSEDMYRKQLGEQYLFQGLMQFYYPFSLEHIPQFSNIGKNFTTIAADLDKFGHLRRSKRAPLWRNKITISVLHSGPFLHPSQTIFTLSPHSQSLWCLSKNKTTCGELECEQARVTRWRVICRTIIIMRMWRKMLWFISAFTYPQAPILPHWHLFQDLQENKMFIFTAVIIQDNLVSQNNYLKREIARQHSTQSQTTNCTM